jgi:hypothetical protein
MLLDEKSTPEAASDLEWKLAFSEAASSMPLSARRDDRTTPEAISTGRLRLAHAEIKHLSTLIGQLVKLRNEPEKDEYGILQLNKTAFDQGCCLLIDAAICSAQDGRQIPYGCASTDSMGGLRIEWIRPESSVHLVIPAAPESEAYIYHEVGARYATESATSESLSRWLPVVE